MALHIGRSRLPELLKNKGLTQADFARLLGVSEPFVSEVIKGPKHFSYSVAARASYILGCQMEDLHEIKLIKG